MITYSGKMEKDFAADEDLPGLVREMQTCLAHALTIKTSACIDVYRARWRDRDVVVKWYKHVGMIHSFRYTLKSSRARRAWINGHRLLDAGIRTPRPLAYIDEHRGPLLWQSWLITGYVDRPTLYGVLHDRHVSEGRKRRLIHQALRQVDRLGLRGISHGDMKHTNILCDAGRIVLTDLDGMEIHQLGWLHRQRRGRDIARFLRGIGSSGVTGPADLMPSVQPAGWTELIQHAHSGLWVNPDFRNSELQAALAAGPQALAGRFRPEPVHSSQASRVWRLTAAFDGVQTGVYLKAYLDRSVWDRLKHMVRPSRAMRALRAAQMLKKHGFHVPEIIAVGNCGACFMATREVTDAVPVYRYFVPDPAMPVSCSLREKRELLRQFGLTVGRMHSEGIVHGDLRPGNVLARRVGNTWEFFFIDNERTGRWRRLPSRLRLKNLVQVNMLPRGISRTDRLRFFLAYTLANPSVRAAYRQWTDLIMTRTHRRFRRKGWS